MATAFISRGPVLLDPKNPLVGRRSFDTAAISAKAKDFAIFARPAAQQLLRQRLR
jgi:hypothetical protein